MKNILKFFSIIILIVSTFMGASTLAGYADDKEASEVATLIENTSFEKRGKICNENNNFYKPESYELIEIVSIEAVDAKRNTVTLECLYAIQGANGTIIPNESLIVVPYHQHDFSFFEENVVHWGVDDE